jgi:hypothetical protein
MRLRPLPFLLLLLTLAGCDQLNPKATSTKAKPAKETPVHRFALSRADEGVAFDTQTGQICRTWDWKPGGKPSKPDPESGFAPQRTLGEFAPTCLYLYEQYPSTPHTRAEGQADE